MAKLEKKIQKRAARKPRTALLELKSYLKSIVNVFLNTSTIVIESTSSIASWVSETISAEYLNINKMTNQAKTPIKKKMFFTLLFFNIHFFGYIGAIEKFTGNFCDGAVFDHFVNYTVHIF